MENPEVARIFDEVADLLELENENPFRVQAYRNAARTVRDLAEPIARLVREAPKELTELSGIGKDLAGKIVTIVETGDLPLRRELCQQVPAGLRELLSIPGCGPIPRSMHRYAMLFAHRTSHTDINSDLDDLAFENRTAPPLRADSHRAV